MTEERKPFWAKCTGCSHCWPAAYLPMEMQGAKETASFVFALSDRVSGGVRDVTDFWPPSAIGKVIEHEPPAAPPAPPSSRSDRVSDFYYGFLCGLAVMMVVTWLAMGRV